MWLAFRYLEPIRLLPDCRTQSKNATPGISSASIDSIEFVMEFIRCELESQWGFWVDVYWSHEINVGTHGFAAESIHWDWVRYGIEGAADPTGYPRGLQQKSLGPIEFAMGSCGIRHPLEFIGFQFIGFARESVGHLLDVALKFIVSGSISIGCLADWICERPNSMHSQE